MCACVFGKTADAKPISHLFAKIHQTDLASTRHLKPFNCTIISEKKPLACGSGASGKR